MNEFTLAEHVIALSNQLDKPITNLKLNVIVPHIMATAMKDNEELIGQYENGPCYVWRYGPIYPKLYAKYQQYRPTPILTHGKLHAEWIKYNQDIIKWLNKGTFIVVDDNHLNPFWMRNYPHIKLGKNEIITYPINMIEK